MSRSARPALPAVVAAIVAAGACLAWSWDVEAAEGGAAAGEIRNARLEERSAAAGLEPVFQAAREAGPDPAWAGYLVPATGRHDGCCGGGSEEGGCCGCRLEGGRAFASGSRPDDTARLEHGGRLWVLYRFEGGGVDKIRTFSEGCALDAGGLRFVRIAEVSPADSLRLLASFVPGGGEKGRLTEAALAAIAFHDDPGADALLESLTAPERPDRLRKKAAFWMGNARGRRGFETLKRLVGSDPSDGFREDVVFALTQSREPEATDVLIDTARRDASARVRGQALFWLAQRAGRKAAAAITRAIEDDPETEVKKKAVFALSQLPKDEGLPLLIRTARENRNPAVRRQAMFWLGQSGDPRALAFFEEVLKN